MNFQPETWITSFVENDAPDWPCPVCERGILEIRPNGIQRAETSESRNRQEFVPEEAKFVFTAQLQCTLRRCEEVVVCCGHARAISTTVEIPDTATDESEDLRPNRTDLASAFDET